MRRLDNIAKIAIAVLLILVKMEKRGWPLSVDGVFALGIPGRQVPQPVLQNTSIDGVSLVFLWKELEPREGEFVWSFADSEIARAQAHGKKISLGVTPGVATPEWVYGAGASEYRFLWDKPWGPPRCSSVRLPIPWDSVFIAKWLEFVGAFATHYSNNREVALIKIEGVNAQTPELFLPHRSSDSLSTGNRASSCGDDNLSAWQSVGYRPEKVKTAWQTFALSYAKLFPNQSLVLETGPAGMPPIDDSGHVISGRGADRTLPLAIISAGKKLIGGRFVVQNDGLQVDLSWPELLRIAPPAAIAYQMAWRVTDDKSCRMNLFRRPCDPRLTLQASIDNGVKSGAQYLEIYIADLLNPQLSDIVADTHRQLISKPRELR